MHMADGVPVNERVAALGCERPPVAPIPLGPMQGHVGGTGYGVGGHTVVRRTVATSSIVSATPPKPPSEISVGWRMANE